MKTKTFNYKNLAKLTKRLVYTQDAILEICECLFIDLKKNEGSKFEITFYNNSLSSTESDRFNITFNQKESLPELEREIKEFLEREKISRILILYEKSRYNNDIQIDIKSEIMFSGSDLKILSENKDWISIKFSALDKIFRKTLEQDYFSLPINIIAIIAYFYLGHIAVQFTAIHDKQLSESASISLIITWNLIVSATLFGLALFLKRSCFPKVEFDFGTNNKMYKRNRKIFFRISGFIAMAIATQLFTKIFF